MQRRGAGITPVLRRRYGGVTAAWRLSAAARRGSGVTASLRRRYGGAGAARGRRGGGVGAAWGRREASWRLRGGGVQRSGGCVGAAPEP